MELKRIQTRGLAVASVNNRSTFSESVASGSTRTAFSVGVVKPSQAAHLIDRHPEPSQRVKTSIELRVQIIVLGSRP
ncbi:hypothetical protein RRG08_051856 [Elysia crispata]|uniref:Uncharacterized protein n=1 Tax=Elysia crispata TaxID=231223 RepID=A0AAE0Z9E3_9GAST|nr:hypothetical protein RRG08_051856 [Elysia crispata]